MPYADVNGQHLYYEDTGGDGPPVILSHGFLMDHSMFDHQVAALRDDFRMITWDERGFGQTAATAPFTYYDSANDALALLDHLGIDQAVFGGMSQGGFLSLRAALTQPPRVKALVLMDTQAGVEDPATQGGYQAMHDEWMANGPGNVQDAIAGLIIGMPDLHNAWMAKWPGIPREQFSLTFQCLVGRDDITDKVSQITAPALIIHGEADVAITMDKAEELAKSLPNCEGIVRVPGGAHAANMTHPEIVNPPLREFLEKFA
jgi:pimeloyl-ACP methyl ester carboxylesterase